jgi:hypothetical protein
MGEAQLAFFHRSGQNPVAIGTFIIGAWIPNWMLSSPSYEPLAHALQWWTPRPENDDAILSRKHLKAVLKSSYVTIGLMICLTAAC